MVPFLWRAAWKVKGPSASRSFSRTLSHCTTNRLPETKGWFRGNQEVPHMDDFTEELTLTVVRVPHCRVFREAGVKVGHEGSNVLCGSQHSVSNLPHEDEPWGSNTDTDLKNGPRNIHFSIHLWIFCLCRIELWWQRAQQDIPDIPPHFPSYPGGSQGFPRPNGVYNPSGEFWVNHRVLECPVDLDYNFTVTILFQK